jgi:hypothetical protein
MKVLATRAEQRTTALGRTDHVNQDAAADLNPAVTNDSE